MLPVSRIAQKTIMTHNKWETGDDDEAKWEEDLV